MTENKEVQIVRKTSNLMESFFEDISKNANVKAVIIIEADSGLSKTKKVRIAYAGSINNHPFKTEPSNFKYKTENIQTNVFNPILEGFVNFDKVTSSDFKFDKPEDFVTAVFKKVDGIGQDEE